MRKFLALFLFGLVLWVAPTPAYAQTQVPNEFQAGQPARASEVNQNFSVLEQAVQQLENETSSASGQVKTAIPLASEARWLIDDYYRRHGALPVSNTDAGALDATAMANDFITGISINNGNVVATFGNNSDSAIAGGSLEFVANTSAIGVYFTCIASAEVAPYFDQSSCVFVDDPPEPLATIRRQFASAIPLASEVRWFTIDFYRHSGSFPTDNEQAGAADLSWYRNRFVTSIAVNAFEVIATYGDSAAPQLAGQTITFVATDNAASIEWTCTTTVDRRYSGFVSLDSPCKIDEDEPPLPSTLIRRQVESGFPMAQNLQSLVETYYQVNGVWPTNNADVGASPPNTIINSFVSGVSVGGGGVVSITYSGDSHSYLTGTVVSFAPTDNGGSISWICTSPFSEKGFLPYECRG